MYKALVPIAACAVSLCNLVNADSGDPLAVQLWPNGVCSVSTHWSFDVVIAEGFTALPGELANADLGLELVQEPENGRKIKCHFRAESSEYGSEAQPETTLVELSHLDHFLDRPANVLKATWISKADTTYVSPNAVHVKAVGESLIVVTVDQVRIAIPINSELDGNFTEHVAFVRPDVLLLANLSSVGEAALAKYLSSAQQSAAKQIVVPSAIDLSLTKLVEEPVQTVVGNTLALRHAADDAHPEQAAWVRLQTEPRKLSSELQALFAKKEAACRESQAVFAALSVAQLNFKPSNGTHTPRWNAEHMMGRELLFFSQIFADQSLQIRPIDLNPKQMPPDYKAAHSDWTGAEEARQMQRVTNFTRRFAYLLGGLDLVQKAPGSFWTPEGLFVQMQNHYRDHTANVITKFELPDWPKE